MRPGDTLVTALVEPLAIGTVFTNWPLHVTIVPWFKTGIPPAELAGLLAEKLRGIGPFKVTMGGEEQLGYKGKRLVNLVELPSPFVIIQSRVEQALDEANVTMVVSRGTWGGEYKPHVSTAGLKRLHAGDQFDCDRLYLVTQYGDHKKVEAEVVLS